MVNRCFSMGLTGMDAFVVEIEADISSGFPAFELVGLPDTAVKEARDRVRAAIVNCGFDFPISRITMNLAPANRKKEGPMYDLPLFITILKSSNQLKKPTDDCIFLGELSLSGTLRPVTGVLPMAIEAMKAGFKNLFLPKENAGEASVLTGLNVYPAQTVQEVLDHLRDVKHIAKAVPTFADEVLNLPDFSDVKGQETAKRALEIAAGGGHNILLIGSPGTGKSMLAKRLPSILPDMSFEESIETSKIHSVAGKLVNNHSLITNRPYRAPHHNVSANGLVGGGSNPLPGEISFAHNGVLFLDEFPEFSRNIIELLRQPMEEGQVTISRVSAKVTYPCNFMLVAAMNPCPCGYFGHPTRKCTCSLKQVIKYMNKISGPILDRIDLHVEVSPLTFEELSEKTPSESSAVIKERINKAREIQRQRFEGTGIFSNSDIPAEHIERYVDLTDSAKSTIKDIFEKLDLSARSYHRVMKVARTIADIEGSERTEDEHIFECITYRTLDRKFWMSEL